MLNDYRQKAELKVPDLLKDLNSVDFEKYQTLSIDQATQTRFPKLPDASLYELKKKSSSSIHKPIQVGVILSGGPAPGGHNVVLGILEGLKQQNPHHRLIGFLSGFEGFLRGEKKELGSIELAHYRNTGGFHLLGSSRKKLQSEADFQQAEAIQKKEKLDALIVIGGDDSNTNGAILANFFREKAIPCQVLGVPKTIDGDLRHPYLDLSFGFDTASKIYSESIGNILSDAKSAQKYYHFIKLMGRSASHLTLECALKTRPNYTFIAEELMDNPLETQIDQLAERIIKREKAGLRYGGILIPEGLLEANQAFQSLIEEMNQKSIQSAEATRSLSSSSLTFFSSLPKNVQNQIFYERDPHGNIPLSQIQTEQVLIDWVRLKLEEKGGPRIQAVAHFLGYEGRSAYPSQFDSEYSYALGKLAAKMATSGLSGYLAGFKQLRLDTKEWKPYAIPLASMIRCQNDREKSPAVIEKTFVDTQSLIFQRFKKEREEGMEVDHYQVPGPIQFFGPDEIIYQKPLLLI